MRTQEELRVWHQAQAFAVRAHDLTDGPVGARHPHIVQQLRRAAAGIVQNIADGAAQGSTPQYARALAIALDAAAACESHLALLLDIRAVDPHLGEAAASCLPPLRRQLLALHGSLTAPRDDAGGGC